MKKFVCLMLSLLLAMAVACGALAEAAETTDPSALVTVDCGDFTIDLPGDAPIQQSEKVNNQVMMIVYPGYEETEAFHSNLNVVWSEDDMTGLNGMTADEFGQAVLAQVEAQLTAQKVKVSNAAYLGSEQSDLDGVSVLAVIYSMDVDYTEAGADLSTTLYYEQLFLMLGDAGTYTFTITADSTDELLSLNGYLAGLNFKE